MKIIIFSLNLCASFFSPLVYQFYSINEHFVSLTYHFIICMTLLWPLLSSICQSEYHYILTFESKIR